MTWLEAFLFCFTVILAVWRRPPIAAVHVNVDAHYDRETGELMLVIK